MRLPTTCGAPRAAAPCGNAAHNNQLVPAAHALAPFGHTPWRANPGRPPATAQLACAIRIKKRRGFQCLVHLNEIIKCTGNDHTTKLKLLVDWNITPE